jgi:GR25 family glycosyltransferase involved in LPS biosynthesis
MVSEKLKNFPKVYCASLIESKERRENIQKQFYENKIGSIEFLISEKFENSEDIVEGNKIFFLDNGTKGAIVSHLKMIKKWYEDCSDEYGFFCEDDLSLDTVQYWNFTWKNFIEELPENWDCVQLLSCGNHIEQIFLRKRYWDDWSVGAYIITRNYAKKLLDSYIFGDKFILEMGDWVPLAEHLIYSTPKSNIESDENLYSVYTFPLFLEEIKFETTFLNRSTKNFGVDCGVMDQSHKEHHIESYNIVLEWWKNIGKNLTLKEILKM